MDIEKNINELSKTIDNLNSAISVEFNPKKMSGDFKSLLMNMQKIMEFASKEENIDEIKQFNNELEMVLKNLQNTQELAIANIRKTLQL